MAEKNTTQNMAEKTHKTTQNSWGKTQNIAEKQQHKTAAKKTIQKENKQYKVSNEGYLSSGGRTYTA